MSVSISFLGGSGTVTGSKYLVRHGAHNVLVDCGLFQGYKQLRLRNWSPLPVAPNQVDAVLLTHAHLDHSGYLPLLVKEGFSGHIWASRGTRDLCRILLPDSGHIQEEDAAFANRHSTTKHSPALPLYTRQDALNALPLINAVDYHTVVTPLPGWKATFRPAGHILGASTILLEVAGRRILFSGDLGRPDDLIMSPPEPAPQADTVLIESTYGDRTHPREDLLAELAPALQRVAKRGGVAVVPVFAVGRAQALLHAIHLLKLRGELPSALPVFLDSPMAVHTTQLFETHQGEHRLSRQDSHALTHNATMVNSTDESKALASRHGDPVCQWHGHRGAGAAPPGPLRQQPPQHVFAYRLPGTRHPWSHTGQRGQVGAHPWPRCGRASRGGTTPISLSPCGCESTHRMVAHHARGTRPSLCGARRTRASGHTPAETERTRHEARYDSHARPHQARAGLARDRPRAGFDLAHIKLICL